MVLNIVRKKHCSLRSVAHLPYPFLAVSTTLPEEIKGKGVTNGYGTFFETRDVLHFLLHRFGAAGGRHLLESHGELLADSEAQKGDWDPSVVQKGL